MSRREITRNYLILAVTIFFTALFIPACNISAGEGNVRDNSPWVIKISQDSALLKEVTEPDTIPIKTSLTFFPTKGKPYIRQSSTKKLGNPSLFSVKPIDLGDIEWVKGELFDAPPQIVEASYPTVVEVKDPQLRENNPDNFFIYSKLQGLRHDQIRSFVCDSIGNIWLGTDDGLTKYDGKYFYHYTTQEGLPHNLILSLSIDSKGNLWIGTFNGGAAKFDGRNFYIYTKSTGLPDNVVNDIEEDSSGNIWFVTGNGPALLKDGAIFTIKNSDLMPNRDMRSILCHSNGSVWISTNGGGIWIEKENRVSVIDENGGFIQNYNNTICECSDGKVLIGSASRGLAIFDNGEYSLINSKNGLSNSSIRSVFEDSKGRVWIGTAEGGVNMINRDEISTFTQQSGMGSNYVRGILEDRDGNICLATRGSGLIRYNGENIKHYNSSDGLSNSRVMNIKEDSLGRLWMGTFGGYATIYKENTKGDAKEEEFTHFGKEFLLNHRVYSLYIDSKGHIWFGTDGGGVTDYDGKKAVTYTKNSGLCDNLIRYIFEDSKGNMWFASYGFGVSMFDGKRFINYTKESGLASDNILSMAEDNNGRLWFASDKGGLSVLDNGNFYCYNKSNGFFSNTIYSLYKDRSGNIWIGTGGEGLVLFNGENFYSAGLQSGLNNGYILSILEDSDGNIWAGTRSGVNIIKRMDIESLKRGDLSFVKRVDYEDGFTGSGCNLNAITQDSKGDIWIGTADKLTRISNPRELLNKKERTIVTINNVSIHNQKINWNKISGIKDTSFSISNGLYINRLTTDSTHRWCNVPYGLSLSHMNNYLVIDFSAISHSQHKKILYSYMLEGLDDSWSGYLPETSVSYGNLGEGNYRFLVRAKGVDGFVSPPESFEFKIRAPWWRTAWFYGLLIISLAGLIYLITRYRVKSIEKERKRLATMVAEQTSVVVEQKNSLEKLNRDKDKLISIIAHDVRAPFNTFIELVKVVEEDIESMDKEELIKIAQSIKSSALNIDALLGNLLEWSRIQREASAFNPDVINIKELIFGVLDSISSVLSGKDIKVFVSVEEEAEISADKYMIETILRNLISNSVKFSNKGGAIEIGSSPSGSSVQIWVKDYGIGMDSAIKETIFEIDKKGLRKGTEGEPSSGLGLIICKELVERHGGSIWVESEPELGAKFIFEIPQE